MSSPILSHFHYCSFFLTFLFPPSTTSLSSLSSLLFFFLIFPFYAPLLSLFLLVHFVFSFFLLVFLFYELRICLYFTFLLFVLLFFSLFILIFSFPLLITFPSHCSFCLFQPCLNLASLSLYSFPAFFILFS